MPTLRSDWRSGDADSVSARDTYDPTSVAECTTAGATQTAKLSVSFLPLWWSTYEGLSRAHAVTWASADRTSRLKCGANTEGEQ